MWLELVGEGKGSVGGGLGHGEELAVSLRAQSFKAGKHGCVCAADMAQGAGWGMGFRRANLGEGEPVRR